MGIDQRCKRIGIVPCDTQYVFSISGNGARPPILHPWGNAVIALVDLYDLLSTGGGPRHHHCQAGGVAAVLAEQGPVAPGHHLYQGFRQFNHDRCGETDGVALRVLCSRGFIDHGMVVTQDHRAVGAHHVDVFVAVDIPEMRALGAGEELRTRYVGGETVVSEDTSWNDFVRACVESLGFGCSVSVDGLVLL